MARAHSRFEGMSRGSEDRTWRRPLLVALLVAAAALALVPAAHAIPFRMRGGKIRSPVVVGSAVDNASLDGVTITNAASVVLDVAAMLPGAAHVSVTDCVCDGGAQIYVMGRRGAPATDRSLVVDISALDGRFCSVVVAHSLPAQSTVRIRNSTIATTAPVSYLPLNGAMASAVAPPLALFRTTLSSSQLRVEHTVLRTTAAGGMALFVSSAALESSAVVLENVTLRATGGADAFAMCVSGAPGLALTDSVLSVTRASVASGSRVAPAELLGS